MRTRRSHCPRQESNLHIRLRSPEFYPLNYEGSDSGEQCYFCNVTVQILSLWLAKAGGGSPVLYPLSYTG